MNIQKIFNNATKALEDITLTVKNQSTAWNNAINNQIQKLEDWRNANDVDRIEKFELDLTNLDANTMYPIVFSFGNGAQEQRSWAELNIGRCYNWNQRDPSPFSDNSSKSHIAGLSFRAVGQGCPWSGSGWNGAKVELYNTSYMKTLQLFSFSCPVYHQSRGDSSFNSDNTVKPTGRNFMYSGMYVRGGLLYKGYVKGMGKPSLYTTPHKIYDNNVDDRGEWVAPFPYITTNNMSEVNNYGA